MATDKQVVDISCNASSSTNMTTLSDIESALEINRLMDEKYKKLESLLRNKLSECRQKLAESRNSKSISLKFGEDNFRYSMCAKPYFKDHLNISAPDNEDTISMSKLGMYDFSHAKTIGWTPTDKTNFLLLMHKLSLSIKHKELLTRIKQIECESKTKDSKISQKKIIALNKQLTNLKYKSLADLALPVDQDYDWNFVAKTLKKRHTASEYKSIWKLYLHPSVNKNAWSKRETCNLLEIARNNNYQDWDAIASTLNTGRTGYQCYSFYKTRLGRTASNKKWTKDEEDRLRCLVERYKEGDYIPWGIVTSHMKNRRKVQVYNKYLRLNEKKKGRFLPEEDTVLLTCIENFGLDFKKAAEYLPGRSHNQLRIRHQTLKKRISHVWTVAEDKKLINLMANQNGKNSYANISKHFPSKDRISIRSRYNTLMKWMKRFPNKDILWAPRTPARVLVRGSSLNSLDKALECLKEKEKKEVKKKNRTKISTNSTDEVIDDAIIAALINEDIEKTKENEQIDSKIETNLKVSNVKELLVLLKANLDKDKFSKSHHAVLYPQFIAEGNEIKRLNRKTYSKNPSVETLLFQMPDVFGKNPLRQVEHVLPPNLATIIGCRKLLEYVLKKPSENKIDLNLLSRKSDLLKTQINLLKERFTTLFLWPLLLSNESPLLTSPEDNTQD